MTGGRPETRGWRATVRGLTRGLQVTDVPGELRRDASRAWMVLTREYADEEEPPHLPARWWRRVRILFLGLTLKLSPARRLLFVAAVAAGLVGLQGGPLAVPFGLPFEIPDWFMVLTAMVGLVLLLMLELADRVLVRDELEIARALQQDLLPDRPPEVAGWRFAASARTANTIGGDLWDVIPLDDGRLAIVTGDASGHGIAAGLLMAIASSTIRLGLDLDPRPEAVAAIVNRALYRAGGPRAFMTLFLAILDPPSGRLESVCVGHPYPMLRRAGGQVEEIGSGCIPLGLRPLVPAQSMVVHMEPGDVLVMYSDGVPETLDPSGASFGFERLRQLVAHGGPAARLHDAVVAAVDSFALGEPVLDDRTIVVMERVGASVGLPPTPGAGTGGET